MQTAFSAILAESRAPRAKTAEPRGAQARPHFQFTVGDDWTIKRWTSPGATVAKDFGGLAFHAEWTALAKHAQRSLSRREADFLWVVLAAYLADRLSPRAPYGNTGAAYWRRKISVRLAVSEPERWRENEARLLAALAFLTEDDWAFEFLPGRAVWDCESQSLFPELVPAAPGWVARFSGGLDSFAGALHAMQRFAGQGVLVSGQTCSRIAVGQHEQAAILRERVGAALDHVGLAYGFDDKAGIEGFESTQRTRAFVHVAFGALTALMTGRDALHLFENGFGALNLACDAGQIGSQNSRGTHPVFLRRMGKLVEGVFERSFRVANPFLYRTKAEMLGEPGVAWHAESFARTFSCDRYPNYPHRAPQCGVCPSCLVRRQALHAADLPDPGRGYTVDVLQDTRVLRRERELTGILKLTEQAEYLARILSEAHPWPALAARWPELLRTERELAEPDFSGQVVRLLKRHVSEWRSFSAHIAVLHLAQAA